MFVLLDLSCCKDLHFLPLSEEKTLGIEGLITTERSQLGGKINTCQSKKAMF